MRRRQAFCALAAGVAASSGVAWITAAGTPTAARRLVALVRRPRSAAVVGRAYLAGHPEEASVDLLTHRLEADIAALAPSATGRNQLGRAMATLVRDDFERERVVKVEGYILSRAEARLCALAALT